MLLSICLPTYNRAEWIRFNLPLWAEQVALFPGECEVVVSDNDSSDDTPQAVEEARAFGSVVYSRNEQNIGGNPNMHHVVANVAKGEFAWVVGDDDTPTEGVVARVLDVLRAHPQLDYVYVNYASWSPPGAPSHRLRASELPLEIEALNPDQRDRPLAQLKEIVGGDINCFTPVYASVMRRAMSAQAFEGSLHEPGYSTLRSVVSHALFIADHFLNRPAFYLGRPGIIASADLSSPHFLPIYLLLWQPLLFDHLEARGAGRAEMDAHRQKLLGVSPRFLGRMLAVPTTPGRELFSFRQFLGRNGKSKDFPLAMLKTLAFYLYLKAPTPLSNAVRGAYRRFRPPIVSKIAEPKNNSQTSVSVIIPTYNRGEKIKATLDSALNQTVSPFEILIVDDGSTDGTPDWIEANYREAVRVIRQPNGGVARARNRGLSEAKGEWIAFLDHDDWFLPSKLEQLLVGASEDVGVAYGRWREVDEEGRVLSEPLPLEAREGRVFDWFFGLHCPIVSMSVPLVRRDLLLQIGGFDPRCVPSDDWDLWLRLSRVCRFAFVDALVLDYVVHPHQQSRSVRNAFRAARRVLRKHPHALWRRPMLLWWLLFQAPFLAALPAYEGAKNGVALGQSVFRAALLHPLALLSPQWVKLLAERALERLKKRTD